MMTVFSVKCVLVVCRLNLVDFVPAQTLSLQPSADWYKVSILIARLYFSVVLIVSLTL